MEEGKIRVMLVASSLPIGGMEQVVLDTATGLDPSAFQPHVCCLQRLDVVGERLRAMGLPTDELQSPRGRDLRLPFRLAKLLHDRRIDIVHAHDSWATYHSVLGCSLLGIPLVQTRHGYLLNRSPRRRQVDLLTRRVLREVVAVSNAHRLHLLRTEHLPPALVTVIHNGISVGERFGTRGGGAIRGTFGWGLRDPLLANVANIQPEKDHKCLILAMPEILRRVPNARLVIVGGFQDRMLAAEAALLVDKLGLAAHVKLMGSREDGRQLLGEMDLFVLPSRTEGFPISVLEAMEAGKAVVASNVGGIPEAVVDGETGLLVPPQDPGALAHAVCSLLGSPERMAGMGLAGRERVKELFSRKAMVARYEALYRRHVRTRRERATITPAAAGDLLEGGRKVLVVGPTPPPPGGMETYVQQMLRAAINGYDLHLLNTAKTTPADRPLIAGVVSQAALFLRLLSFLVTKRPSITHVHTASWLSFYRRAIDLAAAKLLGSRTVLHIHGGSFLRFWRTAGPLGKLIIRRTVRAADRVIILSPSWVEPMADLVSPQKLGVIPNAVDVSEFARKGNPRGAAGISADDHVILFMGSMLRRKGIYDLAKALPRVVERDGKALLVMAGPDGEPGSAARLADIFRKEGVADRVRMMGPVVGSARVNLFLAADVFVLPSYAENMPMSVLEAFASGLPVVATLMGCIPEMVSEGVNGYLVKPGDVRRLAERLADLLNDEGLRRRMGAANRAKAVHQYDFGRVASQLRAEYESVLGVAAREGGGR